MSNLEAIADRFEIEALRGEFTDALMVHDYDHFVQTTHPGTIQVDGDTAQGRAYILEFGRMRDGGSELNYSLYHDRYRRTSDGWKFTERVYEVRYLDTTELAGSPGDNR